jgi:polar amino acid transport system substrate-binding protein
MLGYLKKLTKTVGLAAAGLAMLAAPAMAQNVLTLEDIQKAGSVRVGVLVDFPPFGIMNENNEPDGLDVDVAKALADKMGVKIELVPVTGPNRIPYLQTGQLDLVIASLAITAARSEQVLFSDPYSAIQGVMYARKDIDIADYGDLGGHRIGVARASPQDTIVTKEAPADTQIQRFDEISAVYQAVLAGQVDGAVVSSLVALELDKQISATHETKFVLYQQVQGVAMRLGSDELAGAINGYIADMKASGELNAINRKWLNADLPELTSDL